jgi:hypothetical protein
MSPKFVQFCKRSIGCVGVLKDWLIRAVAAALHDGDDTLSLERLHEHTLTLAQCERMALDTTEGEQELSYMESRREHLWHLLQIGMGSTTVPKSAVDLLNQAEVVAAPPEQSKPPSQTKRSRKKPVSSTPDDAAATIPNETSRLATPKKKPTRRKTKQADSSTNETPLETNITLAQAVGQKTVDETATQSETPKKPSQRVGQRKPKRDPVGQQ